ncbi:hypothetical protein QVD17_03509 [Tagetes erecta]|uniref:Uncharacterized protein n=1 Tax=Tagetes erecta TaxID=13708 RepID=A0AAD8LB36_TARER|nr:hypothetical protein QVD17_03509 [Tagetes erecta]
MADEGEGSPKPSNSELMSSAKVMSEAVTGQETDMGKIAGAAADVLDAAASYGIIDETQGLGKIADQAGDYLHKFETTHTTTVTKTDASGNQTTETNTTTTTASPPDDDDK